MMYNDDSVDVKELLTINNEKNVHFAISGCGILPTLNMTSGGFVGAYADISRATNRPVIGWNPTKKKVIIGVRANSNIYRGQSTLKNLGCTKGITLDAGGSTALRVNCVNKVNTTRRLNNIITW